MRRILRPLPALLAALLLAGCSAQPVPSSPAGSASVPTPSPAPAPSAPVQVDVHWDMLEERAQPLARRWYAGYTDDLIPAADYGTLVPYIGSEQLVRWGQDPQTGATAYSSEYLYGLATTEGIIVTDAVYTQVSCPSYHDSVTGRSTALPVWLLSRTVTPEGEEPRTMVGVAARDGSWVTGLSFDDLILSCEAGLLLRQGDTAVMLSPDGEERYRWTVDSFLPPDSPLLTGEQMYFGPVENVAATRDSFFSFAIYFALHTHGPYFSFSEERILTSETTGVPLWIDAYTGAFLDGTPDDAPLEDEAAWTRTFFPGGWHDYDDTSVLYFDDGTVLDLTLTLPKYLAMPLYVTPPLLIFENELSATLTDLEGNILFRADAPEDGFHGIYPLSDPLDGPPLVRYQRWDSYGQQFPMVTILSAEGILYADRLDSPISAYGGIVSLVESEWYLLLDSRGNELLRLPRVALLDRPADE